MSNEEAAQVDVLKYVIGHGVKEGLVERVDQWPGIHSAYHTTYQAPNSP